jgi:hypothetical protein
VAFGEESEILRIARNTIAHQPENLSDDQVRQALDIGMKLMEARDALLERASAPR